MFAAISMSRRQRYLLLAIVTIAAGVMVHSVDESLPESLRDILGDALWAMMIVWWMGVVAPRAPLRTRALVSFAICVAVEVSQRYHTPMLDGLRRTALGHLILGSDYDARDLLSYAAGVIVATVVGRLKVE